MAAIQRQPCNDETSKISLHNQKEWIKHQSGQRKDNRNVVNYTARTTPTSCLYNIDKIDKYVILHLVRKDRRQRIGSPHFDTKDSRCNNGTEEQGHHLKDDR